MLDRGCTAVARQQARVCVQQIPELRELAHGPGYELSVGDDDPDVRPLARQGLDTVGVAYPLGPQ
jgi:hypothetical protein